MSLISRLHKKSDTLQSSAYWSELRTRIRELQPTTLLLLGNDTTPILGDPKPYGIGCAARWQLCCASPGPALELPGNPALAGHIALHGLEHGLDWHFESSPSFQAPLHLLEPLLLQPLARSLGCALACVPLLLHTPAGISLNLDGCETLGRAVNQAVSAQHSRERVVLLACHDPVAWPTPAGTHSHHQQALLRRAIETADQDILRTLHEHVLDSQASAALELLSCALEICATSHCQWLPAERGRNGVQLWPHYLHTEKPNKLSDEYDQYLIGKALRTRERPRW